jgi:CBS domain-containing protein
MPDSGIEEILRSHPIRSMDIEPALTVPSTTRLGDVIATMQHSRAAAAVVTEAGRIAGIFTERDVLNRIVGFSISQDLPIADVMTRNPKTLSPTDLIADAVRLMTEQGYRHIPLVDGGGKNVGMISARNIMEFIAAHYPKEIFNRPPDPDQVPHRPEGG